jgi:outer membrane protein assembly factor BamA
LDFSLTINNYQVKTVDNKIITSHHKKYCINNVYIFPDFDPGKALQNQTAYFSEFDTANAQGYHFIGKEPYPIKTGTIIRSVYIITGELYQLTNTDESYKHLSELQQFKLVNIQFSEHPGTKVTENDTLYLLDCNIQLTPFTRQLYEIEVEGKNSSGNIGFGGNVKYHHKNLFRGAENFDFKVAGSLEIQSNIVGKDGAEYLPNTVEYSAEARLNLPEFLLPFKFEKFYKQFNPKTSVALSYSYQNRPDYNRVISNISYGYYWKTSRYLKHWVNPVELNAVRLLNISPEFRNSIQDPYLRNTFENQFIAVSSYSLEFNNQDINRIRDFKYLRFNIEFAGNLLSSFNKLTGKPKAEGGYYELFGTRYAQYIKTDLDFRYYQVFGKTRMLVYRGFAGIGIPYRNSEALPFIKKYFSGGANSIRAWQVRSVGPGSYNDTTSIPNLLGDIKIEGNIEYRFDMFWILKGAFFIDAGNIWALNKKTFSGEGAEFDFGNFYKELAVGTGLGTRFDFTYFLFRIDFGIKLHDPKKPPGKRWVIAYQKFRLSDILMNIGVAYPF